MEKILLFLFVVFSLHLSSQEYQLKGTVHGLQDKKVTISEFYGNEEGVIDSIFLDHSGNFTWNFPGDAYHGMYRLRLTQNQFMDVIFNEEDIRFSTHINTLIDSLVFHESMENRLYFEYLNRRNLTDYKSELLMPLVLYFPEDDDFYKKVVDKYRDMNENLTVYVDELITENPDTYVARLVKADYLPPPPPDLSEREQLNYLRAHFFDNIDFSDTTLLNSYIISSKVMEYLSLYQNNRMTKEQLEVEFIKAVNRIMDETSKNPKIYEYTMDYLIGGFESYGFDKVITYIADNINLDETCVNSERKAQLEQKVESLKKFAVGKKAPDFTATDLNGNEVTLSEIDSEYTLLVFWATWCPHCTHLIPDLEQIYIPGNEDKLEIVSVSLDDSREELESFMEEGDYDWINIADFKKWQGDVVQLYDIYATPTMYLLFSDRTILAKPTTYGELKNVLFERNILR